MVFWACFNTLILTITGYFFISERAEQRTLGYLQGYLTERMRAESQVFRAGEANVASFKERFLALYTNPTVLPNPDFGAYFEEKPDGTLRLREQFYKGMIDGNGVPRSGLSGFAGSRRSALTEELQRRLVLTYQVVAELGPAWRGSFVNLYTTLPENFMIMYWPGTPWGLDASAEIYFPSDGLVRPTLQSENPARKPIWSPLYRDPITRKWNVTYQAPLDLKGRHLLNVSHDILLDDLMQRLIHDHPVGAYNLILAENGDVIAHPKRLQDPKKPSRGLNAGDNGNPELAGIYRGIQQRGASSGVGIFKDAELDAYVCFAKIGGPGWWFVTVYPRSLVLEAGREAANGLLLLGLVSFALMTLVVLSVLRERVARPMTQMKLASERVSQGDFEAVADGSVHLPEDQNNEIGLFAKSFKNMARRIGDNSRILEQTIVARTLELRAANDELERLSFRDGLTEALNRRAFDRDLGAMIAEAARGDAAFALLLCDIDHFKRYNDSLGHVAGDQALRRIVDHVSRLAPRDRVYRYGGEEFAVLVKTTDADECRRIASEVVGGVAALDLPHPGSPYGIVTVSGGLVQIGPGRLDAREIIEAADVLLYEAKEAGRNRLVASLHERREAGPAAGTISRR